MIGAAFALAALAAVMAAQAAPSTKFYDATVRVKLGTEPSSAGATLRLIFTNDSRGKQPLGSANFVAPAGVEIKSLLDPDADPSTNTDRLGWSALIEGSGAGNTVAFRSDSSTFALPPGQLVTVDALVEITSASACLSATQPGTWVTRAKQSNDFSGNPGNDATLKLDRSNLRPLGSFSFGEVGTQVPDGGPFVDQQILTSPPNPPTTIGLTALDLCGGELTGYGSLAQGGSHAPGHFGDEALIAAAADVPPVPRLAGADISLAWAADTGDGTVTLEPVVVETLDKLVAKDSLSGIDATSEEFDVVEELCYSGLSECTWQDKPVNPTILAKVQEEDLPPPGASLGLGFNPNLATFSCNGKDKDDLVGKTFLNINPREYAENATVTIELTYKKSITGNGPAAGFDLCLSDDNGQTWVKTDSLGPVPACSSTTPALAEAPCTKEKKRVSGGDLLIILFIEADDPWGGVG